MRPLLVALLTLAIVVPAAATTKLRVTVPSTAAPGATISVKVTGPKTGKLRVFVLTRTRVRKADKPLLRGSLRRGKATLKVRLPKQPGTYRVIVCDAKLRCSAARKLVVKAPVSKLPGAPSPTPIPTPTPTPTPSEAIPPRAAVNPLKATLVPETPRASFRMVGPLGATLIASATDGTQYWLEVPEGALVGEETITLTPATVSGVPGASGGVVLEPDGLTFLKEVTLLVKPPTAPDKATAFAFGAGGDGAEVHLAPAVVDGDAIKVALRHFSSAGFGASSDLQALLDVSPTAEDDLASHALAAALLQFDRGQITQSAMETAQQASLRRWRLTSVAPGLREAETDDGRFVDATGDFLAWQAAAQRYGIDVSADLPPLVASHRVGLAHAFERAGARCLAQGEYELMGRMMLLRKLDQQLSYDLTTDELLVRCGRFHVTRNVSIDNHYDAYTLAGIWDSTAGGLKYKTQTPSGITVAYTPGDTELKGTGANTASEFDMTGIQYGVNGNCDQEFVEKSIGPAGDVTVVLELPSNLTHRAVIGTLPPAKVRTSSQNAVILYYDIVRNKNGNPCRDTVPSQLQANTGYGTVLLDDGDDTGTLTRIVNQLIPGTTNAMNRDEERITYKLTHTPCPLSKALAQCG